MPQYKSHYSQAKTSVNMILANVLPPIALGKGKGSTKGAGVYTGCRGLLAMIRNFNAEGGAFQSRSVS